MWPHGGKDKALEVDRQRAQHGLTGQDAAEQDEKRRVGTCSTDFQIISELGRGSYGVVYKVLSLIDHKEYVLKKINIKHMKAKHQKEALKEA